jgi:hypothetical protein
MLLVKEITPAWHDPVVNKLFDRPAGPGLFRDDVITLIQIGWAWVALSIIGSYIWHTRRLDRTTVAGKSADALMWLQYIVLLLLALLMWLFIPNPANSTEPFFG